MDSKRKVGIVGVGLMGHGIAANVLAAGHPLAFLRHPGNQPTADLERAGAVGHERAAALAAEVDVLITCVTGTPQVREVLLGAEGVMEGAREGLIVIECSTAIPDATREIAAAVRARGCRFLDAAMTRTPREAEAGRLNLIVGAEPDLFESVRPLLRSFAENIVHAGPVGAGHEMKLVHNFVSLGFTAVLAEACACATRAGIGPAVLLEVIGSGGGGGVVFERMRPYIEAGDDSGLRFSMDNACKDIGYYNAMAASLGAADGLAAALLETFEAGRADGHGARSVPELVHVLAGTPRPD